MGIVIKTQAQACIDLSAFRPGCLTKHRRQSAQLLDQLADLCGRHGAGSLGSLKTRLQLVALAGAATQRSSQVLNSDTGLHSGNESGNLAICLSDLALQRGVASSRCRVYLLPTRQVPLVGRYADIWHSFLDVETFRRKNDLVSQHAVDAGRDPAAIERAQGWLPGTDGDALVDEGVTLFTTEVHPTEDGYDLTELQRMLAWRG